MKNIHLIPTDKPSRLHFWTVGKGPKLELCELEYSHTRNTQHIYITSDEEIKEGDWFYDGDSELCKYTSDYVVNPNGWNDNKKIILTTDQDLIKDGVQDIDDEFLEWFVRNPSCEEVTVYDGLFENRIWKKYIIIPKEKQKQHLIDMMRGDEELGIYEEPKQETLEKVKDLSYWRANAEEDYMRVPISVLRYIAELENRMYSKEDLRTAWIAAKNSSDFNEWFEQFKKK